jgi:hypothetical protein
MRKQNFILLIAGVIVMAISSFTVLTGKYRSANGSKVAYTNSPHDGPGDCTSCHGGGSATPTINLTASPAFGSGNTYVPGTTYTLTYKVSGYSKFGFDIELNDGNTASSMGAGTNVAVSNCKVTANPYNAGYPANVSHTAPIPSSGSATWNWTAPTNGATVYVYSVGVGANGNNSDSGDHMAQYNLVLTPSSTTNITEKSGNDFNVKLFPNPATDRIRLTYYLPATSVVSIAIYDVKGQLVESILNKIQEEGEQTIDKNLSLNKGLYSMSLTIDGKKTIRKLIVE